MTALALQLPAEVNQAVGVGIDVTDLADFERLPFVQHGAFYRRIYTPDEIEYCLAQPHPARHFAARFAAKEAAVKAFSQVVALAYWQVEVIIDASGAPRLHIWDERRAQPDGRVRAYRPLVSLSHTDTVAAAVVLVYDERRDV